MPPQGTPCPSLPGQRITVGPFVTSLWDTPLHCMCSVRLRPPAHSVRQDSDGTGQEHGDGEEPPSAAHVFLTPPAASQRRGVSLKLHPFPPLPLSSIPQDGGETPQPPQGGLGGGRGSAGEQLSTGALRVVHGPAAAAW